MSESMRLDRFLWWSRISASRNFAQALAESGHFRLNGRRIERCAAPVRVGDVLAFVTHQGKVRVVRVEHLPARRGPPDEGAACYQELVTGGTSTAVRPEPVEGPRATNGSLADGRPSTGPGRTD